MGAAMLGIAGEAGRSLARGGGSPYTLPMHELSVTEEVLRIASEHAQEARATRITAIHLVVGDLSSIVDDSVQFYFDFLSRGTIAEGARLQFTRVPPRLRCRQCAGEFAMGPMDWTCPHCGALGGDVVAGREFYLDAIEVE
jgi:hydrogenase nickel incorporation protein HypA/HybF